MLLEKRVEGVTKIEEKERNCTKMLDEERKMVEKLRRTSHMDEVITHDNKIKTDEF